MPSKRLEFVQALRALAVVLVVLHHFPYKLGAFDLGYAGVDLFFVLSGFIMMVSTANTGGRGNDVATFLIKRFARVWPAYAVTSAMMLVFFCLFLGSEWGPNLQQLAKDLVFFPPWPGAAVNSPGWTLVLEMYFYAVFALCIPARRWRGLTAAAVIMACIYWLPHARPAISATVGAESNAAWFGVLSAYLDLVTDTISVGFIGGIIAGSAYLAPITAPRWLTISVAAGATGWIAYLMFFQQSHVNHGVVWAVPFAALVTSLALLDRQRPVRVPRVLVWIGNISFSIYVVQWAVIHPTYVWLNPHDFRGAVLPFAWLLARYSAAILLLAIVTHQLLETRLSNWVRDAMLKCIQPSTRPVKRPELEPRHS